MSTAQDVDRRAATRRLAELLALTGFAIAQPVLDVTGRSPDFFLYRRPSPTEMRLFVLIVVLLPPLLLWGLERAVGVAGRAAERALHLLFVAVLFGLIVIQVGKHAGLLAGIPLGAVAAAGGAALAVLAVRAATFRQVLVYATPAPLVFALVFTLTTPAGALVRPSTRDGSGGALAAVSTKRPPIVFLLLDEFPTRALLDEDGRIDARLFPNFARLAGKSTWYPNATSTTGSTVHAVPAVLSGRYPRRAVAPSYVEHPENAFSLLAGTYRIKAYETVTQLCPPAACSSVPAGRPTGLWPLLRDAAGVARDLGSPYRVPPGEGESFAEGVEAARRAGSGQGGKLRPTFLFGKHKPHVGSERFADFLTGLAPAPDPTLHFLHMLLPHIPYRRLPSGRTYAEPPKAFPVPLRVDGLLVPDPDLAVVSQQRLLLQIGYVDLLLGQLIDRMVSTRLWDESLLVVTADHGFGLVPGARPRRLNDASAPDVPFVPLFVKLPRQRAGETDRRNEEHVDLLPTIADVLDIRIPWEVDGVSLLAEPRATSRKSWVNDAGQRSIALDLARWEREVRKGVAPQIARPELGLRGLFAVGPLRTLFRRKVAQLHVGGPAPASARIADGVDLSDVRVESADVPAMLWGDLDGATPGGSRWLAAAVDGTIAGSVLTVTGTDGKRYFLGMVDEGAFRDGANDVVLYAVDGGTLHPLAMSR